MANRYGKGYSLQVMQEWLARCVDIDGKRLVNLMLEHEVGVSSQIYKVPRHDIDDLDESLD